MINTIIFDIGNVLIHFRWKEHMIEYGYDEALVDRIGRATVARTLWRELDRSDSDYIDEDLINKFTAYDPEIAEEIKTFLLESHAAIREYDYAVGLVKRLKEKGYKIYLLSNYGKANFKYALDNLKFIEHVDGGLISYEAGYVKPERGIYDALIDKYKINPKEAVFLDDVKDNVDAASELGFNTIHFTELDKALEELRELGVNI